MNEIHIRKFEEKDIENGFLEAQASLAETCDSKRAREIWVKIQNNPNQTIFVAERNHSIIGCHTVILEQKMIHDGGIVAHLEDLAVIEKFRREGVGKMLFLNSLDFARKSGCYKALHDCKKELIPYYEKFGMRIHENSMRIDL